MREKEIEYHIPKLELEKRGNKMSHFKAYFSGTDALLTTGRFSAN